MDYKIGGLEPTQLIVIAARPSVGKTGFALNMMLNIASQGYKTSFFSLETTGVSVLKRMLSVETGIELTRIKEIKDLEPDELTRLTTAADKILKLDIDIHDKSNITTHDVRKQALKTKMCNKLYSSITYNLCKRIASWIVVTALKNIA